jgi:hypothetical protein
MGVLSFLRNVGRIYTYRSQVVEFLQFCDDRNPCFCGSVQPGELSCLRELVDIANSLAGPIIEVGTLFGFTTQYIAAAKRPDKGLITIDNFSWNSLGMNQAAHRDFCKRSLFYLVENCNTEIFDGTNLGFYEAYRGPTPAMVFIDAMHTYEEVLKDIRWAIANGVPVISGHDYSDDWPGVKKAVDEIFGNDKKVVGTLWAHIN